MDEKRGILKNIFALSPGRAGSMSFANACSHLENYTSAHESLVDQIGTARFAYPENHIEADNRLTWHLGQLAQKYDPQDVFYAHLTRDPEKIAQSYFKRWSEINFRAGIMPAFANGIVMREKDWPLERKLDVCRFYVETVIANTQEFLKTQQHMDVSLEDNGASFANFLDRIGAVGDLDLVKQDWTKPHNDHKFSLELDRKNNPGLIKRVTRRIF